MVVSLVLYNSTKTSIERASDLYCKEMHDLYNSYIELDWPNTIVQSAL